MQNERRTYKRKKKVISAEVNPANTSLGKEYDRLVDRFANHSLNRVHVRYRRDFEGFKGDAPKPLNMSGIASGSDDGREWFVSHMRRFPLLDGRNHEAVLSMKITKGVCALIALEQNSSQLSDEQIEEMEQMAIEGAGAFMTMYECNLRLVMSIAGRHPTSTSSDLMDMVQDGCVGLRRAIQKFDPDKGFKFSTYATYWIKQQIARRQADIMYDLRLPAHALQSGKNVLKAIDEYKEVTGREPTDKDLLELGFSAEDIFVGRKLLLRNRMSLDRKISDDSEISMYNFIPAQEIDFDALVFSESDRSLLSELISMTGLNDREKIIISLKEGVHVDGVDYSMKIDLPSIDASTTGELLLSIQAGGKTPTYDELGAIVGVTRERIRQVLGEAKTSIVRDLALRTITDRLLLDEDEVKMFEWYFKYMHKTTGRKSSQMLKQEQQWAKKVVSLLDLLDYDKKEAAEEVVLIFRQQRSVTELNETKIRQWLNVKFNIGDTDMILPTRQTENVDMLNLDSTNARIAESTMLAVLAGIWGKVPESALHSR